MDRKCCAFVHFTLDIYLLTKQEKTTREQPLVILTGLIFGWSMIFSALELGAEKDRDCAGDSIVKSWGKVILDNLVVELQRAAACAGA